MASSRPQPAPSDAELVAACCRGEVRAWTQLVLRYEPMVWSVPRRFGLAREECALVLEGVFGEVWRGLANLESPGRLRAWLITVARRRSLARLEEQPRWANPLPDGDATELDEPVPAGEGLLRELESQQAMRTALDGLPERCRDLMEWLILSDPPPHYAEIGRRLGISSSSVGLIRGRCLRRLRRAWDSACGRKS